MERAWAARLSVGRPRAATARAGVRRTPREP